MLWKGISIVSLLVAVGAMALAFSLWKNQPRLAFVYNDRILNEYNGIKEGRQVYQQQATVWQANVDTLRADLQRSIKTYQSRFEGLSESERKVNEESLAKKERDFLQYQKAIGEMANEEDKKLTNSVLDQVDSYILDFGKKEGYDYIFGVSGEGNLMFAQESDDITDIVLQGLNNTYEGE